MHEYIKVGEGVISWALTKAEPEIFRGEGWVLDVQGINQVLIFKEGGGGPHQTLTPFFRSVHACAYEEYSSGISAD